MKRNDKHILILGGGYAGVAAALRLARRAPQNTRITLVDGNDALVERVRLHQLGVGQSLERHPYTELLRDTGVQFLQGWVRRLDLRRGVAHVDDRPIPFDRAVVALGSRIARRAPGATEHALPLNGTEGAGAIANRLEGLARAGGTVSIVGGGLTGIELASELAETHAGLRVNLVSGHVAAGVSPRAEAYLQSQLRRMNVHLENHGLVAEVGPDGLTLDPDRVVRHDLCIWAAGFVAPGVAANAGMHVNRRNQIMLDPQLRSLSHPDVYVAGDAGTLARRRGAEHLMSCRLGIPMAIHAADNLARELRGKPPRPWVVRDSLRCISLGRHDGVVQLFTPGGNPTRFFVKGRAAAWIKERVVRSTIATLRFLGWQARRHVGPGATRRPALPAGGHA